MSEAPERLWVDTICREAPNWAKKPVWAATEYVRADLAARIPPLPDDVAGLVQDCMDAHAVLAEFDTFSICQRILVEAATMLEAQAARIAALEARIAAADRLAEEVRAMEQAAAEMGFSGGRIGAALTAYLATKGEPK